MMSFVALWSSSLLGAFPHQWALSFLGHASMGAYMTWERALSMGSGYMASSEGFSSSARSAEVLMWEMCYLHVNAPINFGALHPGVA